MSTSVVDAVPDKRPNVRGGGVGTSQAAIPKAKANVSLDAFARKLMDKADANTEMPTDGCSFNDPSLTLDQYPTIDGVIGNTVDGVSNEYEDWQTLGMYDAGKNIADATNGNVRGSVSIAYFCPYQRLCVAAYSTNGEEIDEDNDQNWMKIGSQNPNFKLILSQDYQAIDYQFLRRADGKAFGWEACWQVAPTFLDGKTIEVHYNSVGGETRSSGRPTNNGKLLCFSVDCNDDDKCSTENDCSNVPNDCANYDCNINGDCVVPTNMPYEDDGTECTNDAGDEGCCKTGVCDVNSDACDDGTVS
ncbi:MAG: hypothetical protein SGARI_000125 [Bacillariaceae sp.]